MHNTGKFNKRITFQRIVHKSDALGDHPVPEPVATRWASVRPVRGSEYYEAQKLRPEKAYVINCRYFLGMAKRYHLKCRYCIAGARSI